MEKKSAKGTKVTEEKEIRFTLDKETKNAVRFVAEELENTNIYFRTHELEDLGLKGKTEFTMVLKAE